MTYPSVDRLQNLLAKEVFGYAADAKKAAGRALGTIVEVITFYALKAWGLERSVAIERPLPEFGNAEITHNVEYSLHPSSLVTTAASSTMDLPLTARKIARAQAMAGLGIPSGAWKNSNALLDADRVLRNACTVADLGDRFLNAYLDDLGPESVRFSVMSLRQRPYAIVECKRVGVEEGMKKGPQTIEKAKQGAYVARTVSALQRFRLRDGTIVGMIEEADGSLRYGDYYDLLSELISSSDPDLLSRFILTVGVVSNHGNWFTSDSHNKELKVLSQSYDWLLFLTDVAISRFVEELIMNPHPDAEPARDAFLSSYTGAEKRKNRFTKVKMAYSADAVLRKYFQHQADQLDGWFNVISPSGRTLIAMRDELLVLSAKEWEGRAV